MYQPSDDLLKDNFALATGQYIVTGQRDGKIYLSKRNGNKTEIVLELNTGEAAAIGLALRSVACCVEQSSLQDKPNGNDQRRVDRRRK